MRIDFTSNDEPTVGVELELHLVDEVTGDLVPAAGEVLAELGRDHPAGEHPRAKHELFECTVEVITDVCRTPGEARADLARTIGELREVAARRGLTIMSTGTHPFALARDQVVSPGPRYQHLVESMQWTARRLLICGTHVHVGVRDGSRAIAIVNELQRHLPLFLALSASSPFFEAEDSGLASARSKVFEALPTAGLPPRLTDWEDFEAFMGTLLSSGCIASIREVWWDVRPHPDFGTVELRVCDAAPTLREVTALAALTQALVAWADAAIDRGELPPPPREWTVRENRWLAGRYGLAAELIVDEEGTRRPATEVLSELLELLRPVAARLGSSAELEDVHAIVESGPGYVRQRRVVEAGGSLLDVVWSAVRELAEDRPSTGAGSDDPIPTEAT